MKTNNPIYEIVNVAQYVFASVQSNEVLQYIEFGLSALTTLVLLAFRIWTWWKKIHSPDSEGGKEVTASEIKEGASIIAEGKAELEAETKKKEGYKDHGGEVH
jgi:hypothetical protein